jgi:hypothetical protein
MISQDDKTSAAHADRVPVESLIGVIVHPVDADSVMDACSAGLRRLAIALYDSEGRMLWQPTSTGRRIIRV